MILECIRHNLSSFCFDRFCVLKKDDDTFWIGELRFYLLGSIFLNEEKLSRGRVLCTFVVSWFCDFSFARVE